MPPRPRLVLLASALLAALAGAAGPGARAALVQEAPPGVEIRRDVEYLQPGRKERMDLYLPTGRAAEVRSRAVVILHGGGWTGGSKSAAREFNIGTTLAAAGYVAASIDYRLEEAGRWPTNVQDCKNGVRYLRHHAERLQLDPERIGVIGGSAGGHLALMLGMTDQVAALAPPAPYPGVSDRVDAVVDMYGVGDLRRRGGRPALFGDKAEITPADLELGSPVCHLSKRSPPVLILHGTADTTVDQEHSHQLAAKLKEAGVEHRMILLEGIGHTFDLQTWQRRPLPMDLRPVVVEFFDRHLRPGK